MSRSNAATDPIRVASSLSRKYLRTKLENGFLWYQSIAKGLSA